jgi:phage gpG-like protein
MIVIKYKTNFEKVFQKWPEKVMRGLKEGLQNYLYTLEKQAKGIFGRPGALKIKSGRLRSSIKSTKVRNVGTGTVSGDVGSNVVYAPVQEFGAKISSKNKKYLMFKIEGKWKKKEFVNIPARPFLGMALSNTKTIGRKMVEDAILKELNK